MSRTNKLFALPSPSQDIITSLKFNDSSRLLCTSFDGTVTIYDVKQHVHNMINESNGGDNSDIEKPNDTQVTLNTTILDATWFPDQTGSDDSIYIGCADGYIRNLNVRNQLSETGSRHKLGVCKIKSMNYNGMNLLIAGSWDKSFQIIDPRNGNDSGSGSGTSSEKFTISNKIFNIDTVNEKLVLSTSDRLINIFDIRNLSKPLSIRENGFKYQTRSLKCMPNGDGFIQGSIEGRVSVEYFDQHKNQDSYAFKCHRISGINDENSVPNSNNNNNLDLVGPINSINFHKDFGTLFTGGSDGHVCIWDYNSRKRIKQYGKLDINLSVMETDHLSLNFTQGFNTSNSGILAIGYSNDGFKNIANTNDIKNSQPIVKSKVLIKLMNEKEGLPKKK
ncbi:hypothetical protein B5S27_g1642 [[Candida] boidinii]|nr:hypothetical protein B5S27_g1642 [[Candida] boidinii]